MIGSCYFRSSGPFDQYGLSARAIAINTAMQTAEEFPRFTHFWLSAPRTSEGPLAIYALLDGPNLTGAIQILASRSNERHGTHLVSNDIQARFFVRKDIERVGVAPLSSMYWYGEAPHKERVDWRPEIHDSDGLAILTGSGERLWRPLVNPSQVMTNSFMDKDVKGFGLLQRDRNFDHYLDDGVFYNHRPSTWIEPFEDWGEGSVQLIEMPTGEETWDNIVAYWAPKAPWKTGETKMFRYRLNWLDDIPFPPGLARVISTRSGIGGPPGQSYKDRSPNTRKFVLDFEGANLAGLNREDGVEFIVSASRGSLAAIANYPVVSQPNRWRGMFDLTAEGQEPVDLRGYLRTGDGALSETWIYQSVPEAFF